MNYNYFSKTEYIWCEYNSFPKLPIDGYLSGYLNQQKNFNCPYLDKTETDMYPLKLPCTGCSDPVCPKRNHTIY